MQGATWQQAMQWMEERRVQAGDALEVIASHDTYSISFAMGSAGGQEAGQDQSFEEGPATRPSMHTGMQLKVGMKLPCPRCVALGRHCNFSAAVCELLTYSSSSITMLLGDAARSIQEPDSCLPSIAAMATASVCSSCKTSKASVLCMAKPLENWVSLHRSEDLL